MIASGETTVYINSMKVSTLLQQTGMWRASRIDSLEQRGTPTGFPELDEKLADGGWPERGVIELLFDHPGIGELRLLAPALAQLSREQSRWLLWVSPPWLPYPPALARAGIDLSRVLIARPDNRRDALWTLEKALSSQSCSAVLAWPRTLKPAEIRRIQVASKDGNCLGILMRPASVASDSSPAELRMRLNSAVASPFADASEMQVEILKRRGGWATAPMKIRFDDELNRVTPNYPDMQFRQPRTARLRQAEREFTEFDYVPTLDTSP